METETPRYELLQPWYAPGDHYIVEGTEVEYAGTPNESMRPLNKAAEDKLRAYLGGRPRTPRVEDVVYESVLKRPKETAEDVVLPGVVRNVPQMGNMKPSAAPDEVKIVAAPSPGPRVKKLMGTVIKEGTPMGETGL